MKLKKSDEEDLYDIITYWFHGLVDEADRVIDPGTTGRHERIAREIIIDHIKDIIDEDR